MDIKEGNILIAEFMGMWLEVTQNHSADYEWLPMQPHSNWCFQDPPPFDSDWRWLMPVVEKIAEIFKTREGYIRWYYEADFGCEIHLYGQNLPEPYIIVFDKDYKKAHYLFAIEAIQWYNKNK